MSRRGRLSIGLAVVALGLAAALWPRAPTAVPLRSAARPARARLQRLDRALVRAPERRLRCGDIECDARTQLCCAGYLADGGAFGTECAPSGIGCPARSLPMACWSDGACAPTAPTCCFGAEGAHCASACEAGEQALAGNGSRGQAAPGQRLARRLRLPFPSQPVPLEAVPMATTREK